MLVPKRIKPGDTIGICAPSGSFDVAIFNKGLEVIKNMGFRIYVPDEIYMKSRYFAGDDICRAEVINRLFSDPEIKGIFCARGGFGAMRVLPFLDYDMIGNNPKVFVGFSDVTAILVTLAQRCCFRVFHGPVVTSLASASIETIESFFNILTSSSLSLESSFLKNGESVCGGRASGPISGGNLATLSHLTGTLFQPDFNGTMLFLEDIGEPPYKIDRMLTHMKMAGVFNGIKGLITGSFENCGSRNMIFEILYDIFSDFSIPVLAGIEAGHGKNNFTLPFGYEITIDADKCTIM